MENYASTKDPYSSFRLRRRTPIMSIIPLNNDIDILDRMIFSEIGELDTDEKKLAAIALVNAFLNLSSETKESIAILLTGEEFPEKVHFGPKDRLFSNGRRALASTEFAPLFNNYKFITDICIGKYPDPLHGEWIFFRVDEEKHQDYIRTLLWGLNKNDGFKYGLRYGDYEFSPIGFLKAKATSKAPQDQLERWDQQKLIDEGDDHFSYEIEMET